MTSLARSSGSGALFDISGEVSNNATWDEYIYFAEQGVGMDLADLSFQLQFRCDRQETSAEMTLSTTGGQLSIVNDDLGNPTILAIYVAAGLSLDGDYTADLVSKDADDKVTHWASGIVTFSPSPVAF